MKRRPYSMTVQALSLCLLAVSACNSDAAAHAETQPPPPSCEQYGEHLARCMPQSNTTHDLGKDRISAMKTGIASTIVDEATRRVASDRCKSADETLSRSCP
jgi:hypothetical protein